MNDRGKSNPSWIEWSRYVLEKLKDLDNKLDKIDNDVKDVKLEIAMLKVRASIWGSVAGAVIGAISILIQVVLK